MIFVILIFTAVELQVKDKNIHAITQGPAENSHVVHYRNAVSKYPFSLSREPWLEEEKRNLLKGIRQQFQEMLTRNLLRYVIFMLS